MLMHQLLIAAAERRPDKLAFRWVDRGRSPTYAQAAQSTGFDAVDAAEASTVGNPIVLDELMRESLKRGRAPERLRFVLTGGAPMPSALGYPDLAQTDPELARIGPPLPDKEMRIFAPDDRPLPLGEIGDIVLRGGFMCGYWGRPDKNAEATHGGGLCTGDLGLMDHDGAIALRSGKSELTRVDDTVWYPRDIEEEPRGQRGVRQEALIGVKDPAGGTHPVAFITVDARAVVDGPSRKRALAAKLAYDLAPLEIRVVPELPMTPTGKISKADLAGKMSPRLSTQASP